MQAQRPTPSPYESLPTQQKKSLANIAVPPLSSTLPTPPLRRKPLPPDSPVAARFSASDHPSRNRQEATAVPYNTANPPPGVLSPPLTSNEIDFQPRNLDEYVLSGPPSPAARSRLTLIFSTGTLTAAPPSPLRRGHRYALPSSTRLSCRWTLPSLPSTLRTWGMVVRPAPLSRQPSN
jgi:hypothetical protein